ncbi:proteasome assembly chaperone family protein [Fervidicoccus fontis]|uniref:Proteasome assembly chaperone family protein n=1 Tax=Fervidicoccus fontis TaxID=683846 RepID=A0A843A955_9CREN|nr:PAC2 family protein [Fervidicoccus fontis]MBE9391393.1 proteasome assembly chaperone family protein [Fervidicoccus fontis]
MVDRIGLHIIKRGVIGKGFRGVSGFKGFGAVGIISALHLVNSLKMERIGIITTKYHPEYVYRDDYGIAYPFEIFASKENKLVVFVTREIPDERIRDEYVYEITKFAAKYGISPLVLIGGLDKKFKNKEDEKMRWLKNSYYRGESIDAEELEKGLLIIGPLALQLMYSELLKVPAIVLLPYANAETPDPAAAATAIEALNKLFSLSIDNSKLIEEGKMIEEEIKKLEEIAASRAGKEPYM